MQRSSQPEDKPLVGISSEKEDLGMFERRSGTAGLLDDEGEVFISGSGLVATAGICNNLASITGRSSLTISRLVVAKVDIEEPKTNTTKELVYPGEPIACITLLESDVNRRHRYALAKPISEKSAPMDETGERNDQKGIRETCPPVAGHQMAIWKSMY